MPVCFILGGPRGPNYKVGFFGAVNKIQVTINLRYKWRNSIEGWVVVSSGPVGGSDCCAERDVVLSLRKTSLYTFSVIK